jgi:hypothetical protein
MHVTNNNVLSSARHFQSAARAAGFSSLRQRSDLVRRRHILSGLNSGWVSMFFFSAQRRCSAIP